MNLPTKEKSLEAVLVIGLGLLVLFIWTDRTYWLWIAVAVMALAAFSGPIARWIAWLWFQLAEYMGRIMGSILLSIIFFLMLTPIALLARMFRGNSLQLHKKSGEYASYFKERNHDFQPKDLQHPW